jgi:hypothetical protein
MDPAVIIAAILGAGGIGGAAAWRKAGQEADSIAASTLIEVNKELRLEIKRLHEETGRLRGEYEAERDARQRLQIRVEVLERRLDAA